jgi:hypothetical protein
MIVLLLVLVPIWICRLAFLQKWHRRGGSGPSEACVVCESGTVVRCSNQGVATLIGAHQGMYLVL